MSVVKSFKFPVFKPAAAKLWQGLTTRDKTLALESYCSHCGRTRLMVNVKGQTVESQGFLLLEGECVKCSAPLGRIVNVLLTESN